MRVPVCLPIILSLAIPAFASAGQSTPATPQPANSQSPLSQLAMSQPLMPQSGMSGPAAISHPVAARPAPSQHPASGGPQAAGTSRTAGRAIPAADPATLCETAVTTSEYVNRLPPRLLDAVSLTETGRPDAVTGRLRPWPWTINAEGEGQFFETRQQAIDAVKALQARGVQSIDVGCLQVNLMYHPDAFASLDDAFDPRVNANYAAHFLNALYADSKDWPTAVGAYHSETPALGDAYRVLVMARWQNGDPHAVTATPVTAAPSAYGDFAEQGKAYGSGQAGGGAYDNGAYGAFAPRSMSYGSFAPR